MADELRIKLLAEDKLSQELKDANKAVRDLKKELNAAGREAERSGDWSKYAELEKSFKDASRRAGELDANLKKVRRELKNVGDATTKSAGLMKTAWSKLQKVTSSPLFTAVSLASVTLFAKSAIQSFAEVEDASSALQATFGNSGDRIISWANESAIAFNLSRKEALTAAQTMAVFGDSAGLAGEDLENFSISLTERAAEAASYFGGSTADAITAFGAALRGENEPIRKYGVLLDDATLRAKAFELGLTDATTKALTPQQKTLAAYNVIMDQTTRVQGDVARTSDSMANQTKQSQAQMENFKTTVGETLAVGLAPMLGVLNDVLRAFNGLPQPLKSLVVAMGVLGTAAIILGPRIAAITSEMRAAGVSATTMRTKMGAAAAFLGGPFGVAIAAGTVALTYFMMEQAEASARVDEFAASIDTVTGKLNQAGVAKVSETLMGDISPEDWQILEKFGFTVEGVTATVIGGADAWDRFREQKAAAVNEASIGKEKELLSILEGNVMGLRKDVEDGTRAWEAASKGMDIASSVMEDTASTTGGVTRQLVILGRELPFATYKASDYYQALASAKRATNGLTQSLSDLSAAVSEWGARDNFKDSLKTYLEDPTKDAARTMITNMEQAANSIADPGEKAAFTIGAIGKIEEAFKSSGLKVPQDVLDQLNQMESDALRVKSATDLIKASIDQIPDSKTVQFFLETTGRAPASVTYNAHGGYIDSRIGGPTSDSVPAMLSRGEFVLRAGAVSALRNVIGEAGLWSLNHSDRSMPSFLGYPAPALPHATPAPAPVMAGSSAPAIGEFHVHNPEAGIDVQAEVLWAMRRADRIQRERAAR